LDGASGGFEVSIPPLCELREPGETRRTKYRMKQRRKPASNGIGDPDIMLWMAAGEPPGLPIDPNG
jgi:hypothetical protein